MDGRDIEINMQSNVAQSMRRADPVWSDRVHLTLAPRDSKHSEHYRKNILASLFTTSGDARERGNVHLLLLVEGSHGLSKSIGRALDFIDGLGGTLDLEAALAGVATPLLEGSGVSIGHGLSKSVGGALDLAGDIGGTLHHVAALTRVAAPLLKSGGLNGRCGQHGNGDGEELHDGDGS